MSVASASISTTCVSESGNSQYDLFINTDNNQGEIKYQFMNQEIFYKAYIYNNKDDLFKGVAVFYRSNTGETKGTSFEFTFNLKTNIFTELNLQASCN